MAFVDMYADESEELMEYSNVVLDVIQESYARMLLKLLPPGPIWEFQVGSEAFNFIRALSYSFSRIVYRGRQLLREFHPDTMFELIPDWERVLGLPGTNPSAPTTTAGRRAAIKARLRGFGDPTAAFFETVALGAGYTAVVEHRYYSPFVAGSHAGDFLYGAIWRFWWTVIYFPGDDDTLLEWSIENLVPSHTDVGFVQLGTDWVERPNPKDIYLNDVCHGNGRWVACGDADGVDAYIVTSDDDGKTWVERSNPKNFDLNAVAYSEALDLYTAVGEGDGVDAYIITSPDGIAWTEQANPKNFDVRGVCWSDDLSLFVAVGYTDALDAYIVTSPDGIVWTEQANPKNKTLFAVCWSDDLSLLVAVGQLDGTDSYIITSPDGITWTESANPKNKNLYKVAWSREIGLLVSVGIMDGDAYIITSPDGIVWTERANPSNISLRSLACIEGFGGFIIAAGSTGGGDAYMVTSPDGITWTETTNPNNNTIKGIAFDGVSRLCAVGENDGTDAYLIMSGLPD